MKSVPVHDETATALSIGRDYQPASCSGVADTLCKVGSAPSNSSSGVRRDSISLSSAPWTINRPVNAVVTSKTVPRSCERKLIPPSPQGHLSEDPGGDSSAGAAESLQRPHTQHIVDFPAVLRPGEQQCEEQSCDHSGNKCTDRVHQVRAGADRHQSAHRHESLGGHHIEAEPTHGQDPGAERQERKRSFCPVGIAPARTQEQHCRESDPTAEGMHHDGSGEIVFKGVPNWVCNQSWTLRLRFQTRPSDLG